MPEISWHLKKVVPVVIANNGDATGFENIIFNTEVGGVEKTGRSSMGTTSALTWQFTTPSKCLAQWINLSLSLCKLVPSSATRVDEAGLENFFCRKHKSFIREPPRPCCSAIKAWCPASTACSFHQEFQAFTAATLVSFLRWLYSDCRQRMSVVLLQTDAGFLFLVRQVAHFISDLVGIRVYMHTHMYIHMYIHLTITLINVLEFQLILTMHVYRVVIKAISKPVSLFGCIFSFFLKVNQS